MSEFSYFWRLLTVFFPRKFPVKEMAKKTCQDCHLKCGKGRLDPDTQKKIDDAYKQLEGTESKSLLKKYLTPEIFDLLRDVKTPLGSTLLDCIQSGVLNPDSGIGIYAPDSEAYTVYGDLFNPIIEDYHMGFKSTDKHPKAFWGNPNRLGHLDPEAKYILSTRVRCGRAINGFPFAPRLTKDQYESIELFVSLALRKLEEDLKGKYYPLDGMSPEDQQRLVDDHFLFKEGDRFLQDAKACRFWPVGRGIFHNEKKTFLVWVNEEDHIRVISMQHGGDLASVYSRLKEGMRKISEKLQFAKHPRLGYLTFCPTNLGTTIRASVHIKLPKLGADREKLEKLASKYNLQVRGTAGEHTESEGGVYDISNKRRLGLTEFEAVYEMAKGIRELIIEEEMTI